MHVKASVQFHVENVDRANLTHNCLGITLTETSANLTIVPELNFLIKHYDIKVYGRRGERDLNAANIHIFKALVILVLWSNDLCGNL
jgi:hypothetical protein